MLVYVALTLSMFFHNLNFCWRWGFVGGLGWSCGPGGRLGVCAASVAGGGGGGCRREASLGPPVAQYWPFRGGGSGVVSVGCFGVGVSVMFRFVFVSYTFGSVWIVGRLLGYSCPLGWQFVLIVFCLFVVFVCFPLWFWGRGLPFGCSSSCSLLFYYFQVVFFSELPVRRKAFLLAIRSKH